MTDKPHGHYHGFTGLGLWEFIKDYHGFTGLKVKAAWHAGTTEKVYIIIGALLWVALILSFILL